MKNDKNIRGIDHIGITVPDIEAASKFLENALGAKIVYDVLPLGEKPFEGKETEQQLGIPPKSKIIHMRLIEIGNSATIELFQLDDAPQKSTNALNDFGLQHFAVYVEDIEKAATQFEKAGGELLSAPHPLAGIEEGKHNRGVYGKAPWGTLIELIAYPDGLQDKTIHRWTPEI